MGNVLDLNEVLEDQKLQRSRGGENIELVCSVFK